MNSDQHQGLLEKLRAVEAEIKERQPAVEEHKRLVELHATILRMLGADLQAIEAEYYLLVVAPRESERVREAERAVFERAMSRK